MKKLLVISGPTVTGKTGLALHLAKVLEGELVSADSRQVYRKMDIGTGKDLPAGSKLKRRNQNLSGYYLSGGVKIWGYDLVSPKKEFSVGQYLKVAAKIIENILKRGRLPILVGGTGLYIKGVVDGIPTASIPKNENLRKSLDAKKADELFEILAQLAPIRAASMNVSDRKNPRRLIRAVEVAQWRLKSGPRRKYKKQDLGKEFDSLFIGLTASQTALAQKIRKRIKKRMRQGIEEEIKKLLKSGVSWKAQSMNSLGYRQWRGYFEKKKTKNEVINEWEKQEMKLAKRQITWFKKDSRINWFDITKPGWQEKVEKLVKSWYSSKNNAEKN